MRDTARPGVIAIEADRATATARRLREGVLKNVTRDAVGGVLQDFIDQAQMHSTLALDSHEYIRSLLNKALGEDKAGSVIDRILVGGDISGIEGLKWMDAAVIVELIRNEHSQIIATILVHLDPA